MRANLERFTGARGTGPTRSTESEEVAAASLRGAGLSGAASRDQVGQADHFFRSFFSPLTYRFSGT